MSPEYMLNERLLQSAHAILWRIENDRSANGMKDDERERAHAAAIGALHGYHFRDAELYYEERGLVPPRRRS